jgi:hypothetical protein
MGYIRPRLKVNFSDNNGGDVDYIYKAILLRNRLGWLSVSWVPNIPLTNASGTITLTL